MTINTDFTDWPKTGLDWDADPYEKASPNLVLLLEYMEKRWPGFFSLGIHYDRLMRNGMAISVHAFAAALDAGYKTEQISRKLLIEEILPFLIANSKELGIQAIHDQGRIWRAYRSGDANGGWKIYNTGYGNWIHIETTFSMFDNTKPISERLKGDGEPGSTPIPAPVTWLRFDPAEGEFGLWPIRTDLPTVKRVTGEVDKLHTDTTMFVQGVILHEGGGRIVVDGKFGRQTDARVHDLQRTFGLVEDGIVGKNTMGAVQYLAVIRSQRHSQEEQAA